MSGKYYQCISRNHPILTYGCIYVKVTEVQGNGLMIVEAPEWGTTYGVNPKHLKEVTLSYYAGKRLLSQREEWKHRC